MTRHLTKLDLGTGLPVDLHGALLDVADYAPNASNYALSEVSEDEYDEDVPEQYEAAVPVLDEPDLVDQPEHYTSHPSGVECIEVTEHLTFCLGNAVKYIWRAGLKGDRVTDLRKAAWYLDREIGRLSGVLYRQAVLEESA